MNKTSRMAQCLIGFMAMCGMAALVLGLFRTHPMHRLPFFTLLMIGIVSSRLKVKLPGLNGNMSMNLPFILLATLQLSLFEALIVALSSILAQCYPAKRGNSTEVQTLFNLSTIAVAVAVAALAAHSRIGGRSEMLALVAAGAAFFALQTVPVAAILALTEGGSVFRIWRSIVQLSFPYFVLSAGVTAIAETLSQVWDWQIPVLVMLTMYGVYRSYVTYFGHMSAQVPAVAFAKAAGR